MIESVTRVVACDDIDTQLWACRLHSGRATSRGGIKESAAQPTQQSGHGNASWEGAPMEPAR